MPVYSFYAYAPSALTYNGGAGTWTLDAGYNFHEDRVLIEITDNDATFNGDDSNNEVGNDATQTAVVTEPDGTPIASGRVYDEEFYELARPGGGRIWIERVEIAGVHVGYMVSEELTPGFAYTETDRRDVVAGSTEEPYSSWVSLTCYAAGARIRVETGRMAVERIAPGEKVLTYDGGFARVIWVGRRHVSTTMLRRNPELRPVRFAPGALGPGAPSRALRVSPQHRMLVRDDHGREVFAPAKGLVACAGVSRPAALRPVTYHHILCAEHEIINADGCWSETLFPGPTALRMLGTGAAAELRSLIGPALSRYKLARPGLTVGQAARMMRRRPRKPMDPGRAQPVRRARGMDSAPCLDWS